MNPQQLVIEEDSLSEKFLELQSNELVQERLIWQHLTRRKINEMNHIPDQDKWRGKSCPSGGFFSAFCQ